MEALQLVGCSRPAAKTRLRQSPLDGRTIASGLRGGHQCSAVLKLTDGKAAGYRSGGIGLPLDFDGAPRLRSPKLKSCGK